MASKLYGVPKMRNTKKNAWCLQWNMVVAVSLCGAPWVLLVSGSCISLMASWIHKCTALYWKRRCYHHSVPLVVVHFSNMTMILNTHLRPLLNFWRRTGWKWFSGQVCLLIWTQSNTYGEFWRDKLSITLQPASNLILEEWKKIDLAKCHQLVHSMPRRLGAVIKNHGGHTKY